MTFFSYYNILGGTTTPTTPSPSVMSSFANSGFQGFLHNGWLRPEVAQYLNSARGFLTGPPTGNGLGLSQPYFLNKINAGRRSPPSLTASTFHHSFNTSVSEEKIFKTSSNGSITGDHDNGSNSD